MMERLLVEFFTRPRATVFLTALAVSVLLTGTVLAGGAGGGLGP
jgi:hypothetical protein